MQRADAAELKQVPGRELDRPDPPRPEILTPPQRPAADVAPDGTVRLQLIGQFRRDLSPSEPGPTGRLRRLLAFCPVAVPGGLVLAHFRAIDPRLVRARHRAEPAAHGTDEKNVILASSYPATACRGGLGHGWSRELWALQSSVRFMAPPYLVGGSLLGVGCPSSGKHLDLPLQRTYRTNVL
jgi:hypothetical protein